MSKEANKQHNEGHHAQNIMLHNKNKPQNVDPIDGIEELKNQIVPLKKQEIHDNELQRLQTANQNWRKRLARTQNDTFS